MRLQAWKLFIEASRSCAEGTHCAEAKNTMRVVAKEVVSTRIQVGRFMHLERKVVGKPAKQRAFPRPAGLLTRALRRWISEHVDQIKNRHGP